MTTDPHILVHIKLRADRYPKLKIYVSELNLDSYKYLTVAHITKYCMILLQLKLLSLAFWVPGGGGVS